MLEKAQSGKRWGSLRHTESLVDSRFEFDSLRGQREERVVGGVSYDSDVLASLSDIQRFLRVQNLPLGVSACYYYNNNEPNQTFRW